MFGLLLAAFFIMTRKRGAETRDAWGLSSSIAIFYLLDTPTQ